MKTLTTPGTASAAVGVDGADPGVRDRQRDELDVQLVGQMDVGDVVLLPGDARLAADTRNRVADRHWSTGGWGSASARERGVGSALLHRRRPHSTASMIW